MSLRSGIEEWKIHTSCRFRSRLWSAEIQPTASVKKSFIVSRKRTDEDGNDDCAHKNDRLHWRYLPEAVHLTGRGDEVPDSVDDNGGEPGVGDPWNQSQLDAQRKPFTLLTVESSSECIKSNDNHNASYPTSKRSLGET